MYLVWFGRARIIQGTIIVRQASINIQQSQISNNNFCAISSRWPSVCAIFYDFPFMGTTNALQRSDLGSIQICQKKNVGSLVKVSTVSTPNVFQIPWFSSMLSFTKRL